MISDLSAISVTSNKSPVTTHFSGLVLAWAVDLKTNSPRYILELDAAHNGAKCNCKCPSCNLPLTAINAGKVTWQRRPHFRHPKGAAREKCLIIAARRAIDEMFGRLERIVLPRRRRSREIEGLSGIYHDAWIERPAESVHVSDCAFTDEANAILTLENGRRLHVQLVGRGEVANNSEHENRLTACIEIQADDPAVANMDPEEILSRLQLVWNNGCWVRHWADDEMDAEAEALAIAKAIDTFDWLDTGDMPDDLSPAERRETLLHREVKAILERERRIRVPELKAEAEWLRANGFPDKRTWSSPDVEIRLSSVELEVHLGHSVPDVVASWIEEDGRSHSMLIEVTVTNTITDERIERLSSLGLPVLEVDISRMGGTVTRGELTRLVLDEVAGKRWLHHPVIEEERAHLFFLMKQEETRATEVERQRQAILDVPAVEWGKRYLDALRRRWQEQLSFGEGMPDTVGWRQAQADVLEAIRGLDAHGYPASLLDEHPLRKVIARILSLHDSAGIGYRTDVWGVINAILCDQGQAKKWHTLYLIALRLYQQTLTEDHREKVAAWRDSVVYSIREGLEIHVRETTYDRLIALLFPKMRSALNKPFGTPLYISEREKEYGSQIPSGLSGKGAGASHAGQPVPRPLDNLDASLLQASGSAAGLGQSPLSFAKNYVRQIDGLTVEQIINRLTLKGVAKDQWFWS